MRLLLDTHAFYWFVAGDSRMPQTAVTLIEHDDSDAFVGVASLWEMAIKVGKGKWPEAATVVASFEEELAANDIALLPIRVSHVRQAGLMSAVHRDPFDRLLAAQATIEGLTLISADPQMAGLGAVVVW